MPLGWIDMSEFQLPADLAGLSDSDLESHIAAATAEFDALSDSETPDLQRATYLADAIDSMRAEQTTRADAAAEQQAQISALRDRVHPAEVVEPEPTQEPVVEPAPEPVAATNANTQNLGSAQTSTATPVTNAITAGAVIPPAKRKLNNPTLSQVRANAPATAAPERRDTAVLVASADIPGVPHASRLADMDALVAAMSAKARTLSIARRGHDTPWYPVASLPLKHRFTLDLNASPKQIDEVLQAATDVDALVAAGGWCSPSEISYDLFNIVCEDGMLDIPSVGINRGGIRYPVSPTFDDVFSGVDSYWTWTETQDVAAVTGTAQSGTKVCSRVPCADFTEDRLRCDGLCLTVGNLMEDAYPELIANHTRLLFAGFAHRQNALRIQNLVTLSVAVTGSGTAGIGVVSPLLGSVEMQAIDYRERFAMCEDAVLELVLPRWILGAMRSDLRKRTGIDLISVQNSVLANYFDALNVRVQFVDDWQVRGSGQFGDPNAILTSWPLSVQFLLYAPGTFIWGRGLQLNLGVIRDSVLNETNDHTGAWMEECWLVSRVGHESRVVTVLICPDGTTGAADLTGCSA